ncbi:two-component regulator propeller domain-containing protein [Autumnicola musiva]|uniref:histidine kinase n=1 Tax=Autumnicola musiva TaxID=3075589 RepID=A0ABU3D4U3_9FLAO|nr:two-component regulator propeller domain-containing protein [Zunongwangia sp. F117]MDT0676558.1 two-component regulator propeller domain-containing protein [Zunongwangia sp. F117]
MSIKYKSLFLFIFCLQSFLKLHGQAYTVFDKIDNSNGLSNGRVTSIVKDAGGFVWIATKNGLNRYDGFESKVYTRQNSSISSNDISDLFLDSKNRLWVATLGGGLNFYNAELDKFQVFKSSESPTSIASNQVNTIFEDAKGYIWLGTENGLSLFDEARGKFFNYHHSKNKNSLSHNSVTGIFQTEEGTLWIGTFGGGLNKFDIKNQQFQHINSGETYFSSFIYTIYGRDKENILLGTSGAGLLMYNIKSGKFSDYLQDLGVEKDVNIVRAITRDRCGDLWIGTDGNGLFKIEGEAENVPKIQNSLYNFQLRSSLSGNAIYEIMEDNKSNLWIGTAWNGINILVNDKDYELLFSDIKGENPSPVLSVFKDKTRLFLGLDGNGLTVYNAEDNKVSYFNKESENYIGGSYFQHIVKNSTGNKLWLGTFANGLISFNPENGNFQQYTHESENLNSLSYNDVRYIIPEENGNLWIATWGGGLNYFDHQTESFKRFRASESNTNALNSDNILALQKQKEKLWIATFGGGLALYNLKTEKFQHFEFNEENSNSPSGNNLFSLLLDSSQKLWIGTSGAGINIFDPETGKFNRFPKEENLRYATVTAIIEDNNSNIWFSTKQGIWQYNRKQQEFKSFPGLNGEFHINSAFKDAEGLLYFGGINGVVRFDPAEVQYSSNAPAVVLTNFKLFNKELPVGENEVLDKNIASEEQLVLKHNADVITFEFAALKFPFSDNCEYAIKMENFDETWRNIGKDRTATFTNLAPGEYTFKVKSRETWAEWGEDYASINITILKPFWLQWWAFCIYILLILALFYLFRRYIVAWEQMKANLRLEKFTHEKDTELYTLKQQFFTNVSHEIRTPVTLILGATNRLMEKGSFVGKKESAPVKTIHKHGKHLLHLVNELLDFRNLDLESVKLKVAEENWISFCEEIFLSFTENAQQKKIDLKWETSAEKISLWFDANQMEKVLYNLLSNALKFTPEGGSIKMGIFIHEEEAVLKVSDTGIGIGKKQRDKIFRRFYQTKKSREFNETGFGLGLSISKEIIDLHKGQLYVESQKGKGSTFILRLLRGRKHFKKDQIIKTLSGNKDYIEHIAEEPSPVSKDVDLSDINGETVMIIEDNFEVREYIAGLLKDYCIIIEAANGKDAIELITDKQPDLIISDIMMPVMDGVSFTRYLKTNPETSHIPVILLTARATSAQRMEGYETGADAYITKPFSEQILKLRIKNLINSRNLLRAKFTSEKAVLPADLAINSLDEKFLEALINTIRENIDTESLNADFLSKELAMSHSVIYKKVKSLTGMTLVEFVRDFKLKIARELIAEKGFSVSEACYRIGYSDRKYFSKLFKKKFGSNPSEYSKK